jgi:hypothetical protein
MEETTTKIPQRIHVPGDTGAATQMPAAGLADNHLPHRNQQEHDGMHQRDDGALAVRQNRKIRPCLINSTGMPSMRL